MVPGSPSSRLSALSAPDSNQGHRVKGLDHILTDHTLFSLDKSKAGSPREVGRMGRGEDCKDWDSSVWKGEG